MFKTKTALAIEAARANLLGIDAKIVEHDERRLNIEPAEAIKMLSEL